MSSTSDKAGSQTDEQQVAVRRSKLHALRENGQAYPNDFRRDALCGPLREEYTGWEARKLESDSPSFKLSGRVTAIRSFGKTVFLNLRDGSGDLQLFCRSADLGAEQAALVKELDIGDIVGTEGRLFFTRTGELTLRAAQLRLLVKSLRPLPEKWHGLTDVEQRYRRRYVDLIVNPDSREVFKLRASVVGRVRSFLQERDFMEVETPMMQSVAGGAAARPFVTHHNTFDIDLYLRVAPELFLKRLVVGGFERVFELNRNFRNEGISTQHNPEFTMLEFYQAYADYEELMDLTEELLRDLAVTVRGNAAFSCGDLELDFSKSFRRVAMTSAVAEATGISEEQAADEGELQALADKLGLDKQGRKPGLGLLADIFEEVVEHTLQQPVFVTRFPLEVSPLSRKSDDDPRFVDRFELFIGGREIANGFSELNDSEDQMERFQQQARQREAGDEEAQQVDEDYVRALEHGLPPTAGEGIGIDRLVMVLAGVESIRDVILFPQLKPGGRVESSSR
ncbi:MAG: lysine--tRNA ligase [Proteobacteria bacterium]|nr:lysine--tRNA ligase [Pseudomonadota bacterium]